MTASTRNICWHCGGPLKWESDHTIEDVFGEGAGEGIVTYLHCTKCGADVRYIIKEADQ